MPQLDQKLIIKIIDTLEEKGDPYYPVSHLAHDLGCVHNEPDDYASLNTDFVIHLLQLEDLGCIENMLRKISWGYNPKVDDLKIKPGKDWETPHSYLGNRAESAIRLTSNARQLREVLKHKTLPTKAKQQILSLGSGAVSAVVNQLALGQLPN